MSNNIIINYIDKELRLWASELLLYKQFLDHAEMDEKQLHEINLKYFGVAAIMKELERVRGDILGFKNVYTQFIIYSEPKETNGTAWTRFYTILYLVVKGEEGLGAQKKYVNVIFDRKLGTEQFKEGGIFTLQNGKYTLPLIYEIKTDPETGKQIYPAMFIDEVASYSKLENGKRRIK